MHQRFKTDVGDFGAVNEEDLLHVRTVLADGFNRSVCDLMIAWKIFSLKLRYKLH